MHTGLFRVVQKYNETLRVIPKPAAAVKFREAVGVVEQSVTESGISTLWYHHLPSRNNRN